MISAALLYEVLQILVTLMHVYNHIYSNEISHINALELLLYYSCCLISTVTKSEKKLVRISLKTQNK